MCSIISLAENGYVRVPAISRNGDTLVTSEEKCLLWGSTQTGTQRLSELEVAQSPVFLSLLWGLGCFGLSPSLRLCMGPKVCGLSGFSFTHWEWLRSQL